MAVLLPALTTPPPSPHFHNELQPWSRAVTPEQGVLVPLHPRATRRYGMRGLKEGPGGAVRSPRAPPSTHKPLSPRFLIK